ncbi:MULTISPECIES: methylenetetrahydrofolate reductase C-terminal domain-containing protein [Microbacterium]|uniref:methylenetetrahydrofolate reductase C-terminal domain-containing protein n=1 Tax=Microbacterium TaxID=33882 RepID=UPI0027862571|nr:MULTISPECIES: methylenetetrahydrofolate reductase C-terminal domain-containing protein [Microbacterium]MDQ1082560.1 5,10-methylenetetrahydrofolate reductase [Microbacterium sp. SORGH_AS_0344]MDQ1168668.1 5,10-methylenetetrahydrofolate reductase [Microbacterium proteolyticum]
MTVLPVIAACPKRMEYGPCGGVGFDGSCEIDADHRCAFLARPTVPWTGVDRATVPAVAGRTAAASATLASLGTRPWVIADLPARALSVASIDACAGILGGEVDAVLAGDAGSARVQFPPAYRAHLLQRRGLRVWTGLNMRDRNRVAIEGELAALAVEGVAGVHCVTGDHTRTGHRPDAAPVFDLDSTEATALARAAGHVVSVAASPAAPPVDRRAARLREKQRAGADVCFVNHAGGAGAVARFIDEVGDGIRYIPCVPVVVDHASADLLESFTTLVLPDGFLARVRGARDPRAEGIALAVALAEEMLALPGVVGVNLSGGRDGGEEAFAEALAEIARRLR